MKKYTSFIKSFFTFLGMQNDYLYPFEGQIHPDSCPYPKAHWWKTRMGIKTAYKLAKNIWL